MAAAKQHRLTSSFIYFIFFKGYMTRKCVAHRSCKCQFEYTMSEQSKQQADRPAAGFSFDSLPSLQTLINVPGVDPTVSRRVLRAHSENI